MCVCMFVYTSTCRHQPWCVPALYVHIVLKPCACGWVVAASSLYACACVCVHMLHVCVCSVCVCVPMCHTSAYISDYCYVLHGVLPVCRHVRSLYSRSSRLLQDATRSLTCTCSSCSLGMSRCRGHMAIIVRLSQLRRRRTRVMLSHCNTTSTGTDVCVCLCVRV